MLIMTGMQPIYLDHNATTSLCPEAAAAMAECQASAWANPESQHQLGRAARRRLEDAREGIAGILGVDLSGREPDQIVFTSGGTEANNLALFGLSGASVESSGRFLSAPPFYKLTTSRPPPIRGEGDTAAAPRLIVSEIEHPSVAAAARELARRGWHVDRLPVSKKGDILLFGDANSANDAEKSRMSAFSGARLVSVMLANNETGVIQSIRELAVECAAAGVPLHTDAVQAVGKVPVNFRELGVAAMTIAAHKFGGPRGIGALVVRGGVKLAPQLFGGVQQSGLRPGTEPVALVAGMHAALAAFAGEQSVRIERMTQVRDRLESAVVAAYPGAVVIGADAPRLPNTSCIAFPGLDRQALVMALDLAGVCCSTGSACASGSSEPSPTLVAMGLPAELVSSSVRFSIGASTTPTNIDEAIKRIVAVLAGRRSRKSADQTAREAVS